MLFGGMIAVFVVCSLLLGWHPRREHQLVDATYARLRAMSEIESHDVDDMAAGAECFDTCAPSAGTENWRVAVWFLILLPMAVAAWLKIGPIAGVIEVAWLLFVAFVRSQPRGPG